ncbi:MAG: CRISPR-associated endonuclease Cas3'' [Dehalococcoidia bacterium]|nr:CRISPR-associated endonuclease Cas3'' [Dehalococcoidia bacterium]
MHDGPWAHSKNERGERDPLVTHLRDTAERAREFAAAFGAEDLAGRLGLWHDLGKFHPDWQDYLLRAEAWDAAGRKTPRPKSTDHKAAGVHLAFEAGAALYAFALEGHHGGMKGLSWTRDVPHDPVRGPVASGALTLARAAVPDLAPDAAIPLPAFMQGAPEETYELFVRMLFSALVDADFLDTEEHFHPPPGRCARQRRHACGPLGPARS